MRGGLSGQEALFPAWEREECPLSQTTNNPTPHRTPTRRLPQPPRRRLPQPPRRLTLRIAHYVPMCTRRYALTRRARSVPAHLDLKALSAALKLARSAASIRSNHGRHHRCLIELGDDFGRVAPVVVGSSKARHNEEFFAPIATRTHLAALLRVSHRSPRTTFDV